MYKNIFLLIYYNAHEVPEIIQLEKIIEKIF